MYFHFSLDVLMIALSIVLLSRKALVSIAFLPVGIGLLLQHLSRYHDAGSFASAFNRAGTFLYVFGLVVLVGVTVRMYRNRGDRKAIFF